MLAYSLAHFLIVSSRVSFRFELTYRVDFPTRLL